MVKVTYYVAASLDGFIATADGSVDWLEDVNSAGADYGYQAFYSSVDALVMGSKTCEQVMDFGDWPYAGKPSRVLSTRKLIVTSPDITVTSQSPSELMVELKAQGVGHVWLVGGSFTASEFRLRGLITDYIISVIPVIIGDGIPLFRPLDIENEPLTLTDEKSFHNGMVQLKYTSSNSRNHRKGYDL